MHQNIAKDQRATPASRLSPTTLAALKLNRCSSMSETPIHT